MIGFFNGCGKTTFVMAQGIIGAFCVRVPVSFFMSRLQPVSLFRIGLQRPAPRLCKSCFAASISYCLPALRGGIPGTSDVSSTTLKQNALGRAKGRAPFRVVTRGNIAMKGAYSGRCIAIAGRNTAAGMPPFSFAHLPQLCLF